MITAGKRIEKQEYNWITEHIELRIKQLKEYYDSKGVFRKR